MIDSSPGAFADIEHRLRSGFAQTKILCLGDRETNTTFSGCWWLM